MTKQRPTKPFPYLCPECGEMAVFPELTNYRTALEYEGQYHEFEVPDITLNRCRECGGVTLPNAALERIAEAFRVESRLLTAEKILLELQRLNISPKEFSDLLAVDQETVSAWLTGIQIQQRSLDRLMRLFFGSADVRKRLAEMMLWSC